MNDLKTTITGLITAVLSLLAYFGIVIPEQLVPVIMAVGVALVSYFAKDGQKTNTPQ